MQIGLKFGSKLLSGTIATIATLDENITKHQAHQLYRFMILLVVHAAIRSSIVNVGGIEILWLPEKPCKVIGNDIVSRRGIIKN